MRKASRKAVLTLAALLALGAAVGYAMIGGKNTGAVHADSYTRTETAAAAAGAKILPTDPPLKVEPK